MILGMTLPSDVPHTSPRKVTKLTCLWKEKPRFVNTMPCPSVNWHRPGFWCHLAFLSSDCLIPTYLLTVLVVNKFDVALLVSIDTLVLPVLAQRASRIFSLHGSLVSL